MKFVYTFCFLILTLQVYPHTVITGTGSGSINQTDMTGLNPGDTLAIRSGYYEMGGSLFNLKRITIINYRGPVDFGKTVRLGNLKQVSFSGGGWKTETYGFRFRNFSGDAFSLESSCSNLSISYCEYYNLNGIAFNASHFFTTYTGDTSTMALYKATFNNQRLIHSGALFAGSWVSNAQFQNVVDSISFLHIEIDSTNGDGVQVIGHSIYRMLASHWHIQGPVPNGIHDVGVFYTSGNGTVCNIYRKNGWGYLWRVWNLGLNGRANSYLYNCIDLSTENYGTVDTRLDVADTTTGNDIPFIRGASLHVINNTTGNKKTKNYVSELVIAGNFCSANGYRLEVRNNLCFNNVATGTDHIIKQNTGEQLTDTSNNIYSENPIRDELLLDTLECKLNPASRAIDQGLNFPFISTDIEGVPRPVGKSADIGAREFPDAAAIRPPLQVFSLKKWLAFSLGTLTIALILLSSSRGVRNKIRETTYKVESQPQ